MRRHPVQDVLDSTVKRRVPQKCSGFPWPFYAFDMDLSQGGTGIGFNERVTVPCNFFFCCT
jgi:hypothetical protein